MPAKTGPAGRLLPPLFEPPPRSAPYATRPKDSRGRLYPEPESATRTCYQRDRDRILHSSAFRRLKQKTQVFVQHEGDYYRTRLTHSLEVAQIARSLARVLALDEDLAEALALAHDLGHTPFGHAGEEALAAATAHIGGFDHNAHALRIVTKLEHRYADFDGLNLTWETLEGLVKHNGRLRPGKRLPGPIAGFDARWPLDLETFPGLEAQVAALADDIAYTNHDIDDGLRAGLFTAAELASAPLVGENVKAILDEHRDLELSRLIGEIVRRLISALIGDLLTETRRRLGRTAPASVGEVRLQSAALVDFSEAMSAELARLKAYLFAHMYHHPRVVESMSAAKQVVSGLFAALSAEPQLLPADWCETCGNPGDSATAGVVRDYIAGMTDRYALEEHRRIFHTEIAL
jgi:dGTPase